MAEKCVNKEAADELMSDECNKSSSSAASNGVVHSVLTRKRKLELQGANFSNSAVDGISIDFHSEAETSTSGCVSAPGAVSIPGTASASNFNQESSVEPKISKDQSAADAGKRNRELWDNDSKSYFFEALKIHGKDFESMTKYIAQKSRNRCIKNYDQVRNFYYNTWSKLCTSAKFEEDAKISREAKELFTLINFGEWRKKTGVRRIMSPAHCEKFNELLMKGVTTFRIAKGPGKQSKIAKIRTPNCPALNKFFEDRGRKDSCPNEIEFQLIPKRQIDKNFVVFVQQNPFVRALVRPNEPMRNLISFLQSKWEIKKENGASDRPSLTFFFAPNTKLTKVVLKRIPASSVSSQLSLNLLAKQKQKKNCDLEILKAENQVTGGRERNLSTDQEIMAVTEDEAEDEEIQHSGAEDAANAENNRKSPTLAELDPQAIGLTKTGMSLESVGNLTAGQLFLMQSAVLPVRLEYEISPPANCKEFGAYPVWQYFLALMKSEFNEIFQQKSQINLKSQPSSANRKTRKRTISTSQSGKTPTTVSTLRPIGKSLAPSGAGSGATAAILTAPAPKNPQQEFLDQLKNLGKGKSQVVARKLTTNQIFHQNSLPRTPPGTSGTQFGPSTIILDAGGNPLPLFNQLGTSIIFQQPVMNSIQSQSWAFVNNNNNNGGFSPQASGSRPQTLGPGPRPQTLGPGSQEISNSSQPAPLLSFPSLDSLDPGFSIFSNNSNFGFPNPNSHLTTPTGSLFFEDSTLQTPKKR